MSKKNVTNKKQLNDYHFIYWSAYTLEELTKKNKRRIPLVRKDIDIIINRQMNDKCGMMDLINITEEGKLVIHNKETEMYQMVNP